MTARTAIAVIVVAGTAVRVALASSIGPGNDEAYYGLYAWRLDWSYFDHPPMVGWLAAVGGSVGGFGNLLGHRLGFIGCFAVSTLAMGRLGARLYGEKAGVWAAIVLNATAYFGIAAGTFILPDGPLLCFWLLTLDRLVVAMERGTTGDWCLVGLAWGGALLSKYQAMLLPLGTLLYWGLLPEARRVLRTPGPYLATAVGLAVASPVVVWNARNGWSSLGFQGGRAFGGGFAPGNLAVAWAGQALYLLPWVAWPLARSLARGFAKPSHRDLLLWSHAVVPIVLFSAVACTKLVFPHWGLIGFVSLMPIVGRDWAESAAWEGRRGRRRLAFVFFAPMVLAVGLAGQVQTGWMTKLASSLGIDDLGRTDPARDLVGWDRVARELERRGWVGNPGRFIFTGQWYNSGHLAFELGGSESVLCYSKDSRAFGDWSEAGKFVGKDGLLVSVDGRSAEPGCYERYFRRIVPLGSFQVEREGQPIREVRLYHCVGQVLPFPYDRTKGSEGGGGIAWAHDVGGRPAR